MTSVPPAQGAVPPPIGEALTVAIDVFKRDWAALVVACLCAMLLGLIPLVGGGLAFAGLMHVSLKALRGQTPEPADGFVGLSAPLDHIVMGLLQVSGILACCLGVYVTQAIFFPGTFFILEEKMDWRTAMDASLARVKPNWAAWLVYSFVMGLVGAAGSLVCGIGVLATLPVAALGLAYAYEKALKPATA